ncbi:MAG: NUDIX domain-containing protein [Candidatus Diapherotrites archaeon]
MEQQKGVRVGIGVMILKNNKVLLGKRHLDPEKADSLLHGEGTWTMPGGKLDFGESFEEGAYREVLEETGIKLNKKKLRIVSITNDRVTDAHFITIGLLCEDF